MSHILIVEDEASIATMLSGYLTDHGHHCDWVASSHEARNILNTFTPDVVLLDWMLPGRSGYEFARELRASERTRQLPLIMLTARGSEEDKVKALDAGADDYVTKPFSLAELLARINALLRRSATEDAARIEVDGLFVDADTRRVWSAAGVIEMSPSEFELLYFLMTHQERVYSRAELIRYVWGPRAEVEDRSVDVQVRRLRARLAPTGHDRLLQTVRGAGYRLSSHD